MTNSHLTVMALNSLGKLLKSRGKFIQGNSVVTCDETALANVCQSLSVPSGTTTTETFNNLVRKLQEDPNSVEQYLKTYQPDLLAEEESAQ